MTAVKLTREEQEALTEPCVDLPLPESYGLSRREYFAACALQGVIAAAGQEAYAWTHDAMAAKAVRLADALIAMLAETPGETVSKV